MFSASANIFGNPAQGSAKTAVPRRRSIEKQPDIPTQSQTKGYGCAVYQDYLVLLGSDKEVSDYRGESPLCIYNLKEKTPEETNHGGFHMPIGSCTPCFYHKVNGLLFYCAAQEGERRIGFGHQAQQHSCEAVIIRREKRGGGQIEVYPQPAMQGPGSAFSVSHIRGETLYVYDPTSENENFGSLKMHSFDGAFPGWQDFDADTENMGLNEPSRHALFINDVFYILTGNVDLSSQTVEADSSVIEDIYKLNLGKNQRSGRWERISPTGRVPGAITHISLTQANGMIYVFGMSQGKSVLWVYNIGDQEWKQVRDINMLTARPDQKAVIYNGQLMIVDWGFSKDSVHIQYLSLDDLNFVAPSVDSKEVCQDQAESFIQDTKNLFTGKLFPDVVFEVEGEEIPAHKAILASRSSYFMKMFTSGMSESYSAKIPISHMKSHIFKALLQYIYCNEVELDEQLALDLIPVVDEYVMKGLKGICEKYLCKQLRKENVVAMLIVADRHEIDELKNACFKFILKNLNNIDENEEMNKLSKSLFIELLKFQTQGPQKEKSEPKKEKQKLNFGSALKQPEIHERDIQLAKRIRGERF